MNEGFEIARVLERAGIGAIDEIDERRGHHGTTCRIHDVEAEGRRLVAKVTTDPAFHERAAREFHVLRDLGSLLQGLAPRLVAGEIDEHAARSIVVTERIEGHPGDSIAGSNREETEAILDRMTRAWRIGLDHEAIRDVPLPHWGRGTEGARPHRRRAERFRRRGNRMLEHFPEAASLHAPLLGRIAERFEEIARTPSPSRARLIHGDLHLDNIVFSADGPRVLDWQTASIGDPVDDVVRLVMESHQGATIDALVDLCDLDAASRADAGHIARRTALAYAGLVSGLAGRPDLPLDSREHRFARRLLATDGPGVAVTTALDLLEAE